MEEKHFLFVWINKYKLQCNVSGQFSLFFFSVYHKVSLKFQESFLLQLKRSIDGLFQQTIFPPERFILKNRF